MNTHFKVRSVAKIVGLFLKFIEGETTIIYMREFAICTPSVDFFSVILHSSKKDIFNIFLHAGGRWFL